MSTSDDETAARPERLERGVADGLKNCRAVIRNYRKQLIAVYGDHEPHVLSEREDRELT